MQTFVFGMVGAIAPEVVRWRVIVRDGSVEDWRNSDYWIVTIAYVLLGGVFAALTARPEPYAALVAGLTTELAILGLVDPGNKPAAGSSTAVEEITSRPATRVEAVLSVLQTHAAYLRPHARPR